MRQLLLVLLGRIRRGAPARSGLRCFPHRPLAGGRRLREPLADAGGTVGGHQGPRASTRVPRRRHSGRQSGSPGRWAPWPFSTPRMAAWSSCRATVRPMLGRGTPRRRRARPAACRCRRWSRSCIERTSPRLPRPSPGASCNSSRPCGRPWPLSDELATLRRIEERLGLVQRELAESISSDDGDGRSLPRGQHADALSRRRGSGRGTQVHAADGPARLAQSRIECRERERHTEGGDGQPGADRELGKAGRRPCASSRRVSPASSRSWRPGSMPFRARSRTSSEAGDASRRSGTRCLRTLMAGLLLSLIAVSGRAGRRVGEDA